MPLPDLLPAKSGADVELRGDAVAQADGLHEALGHPGPAAIETATAERRTLDGTTHVRLRWALTSAPHEASSLEPAPSWAALCADAVACFRTGPWPDVGGWLTSLPPTSLDDPANALVLLWGGLWPHVLTDALLRARGRVPEAARGFFDTALSGLGDVAFAGGRLANDGTALAFARVPATWVNFTSSTLAWTGLPPVPEELPDGTIISWSDLPRGGVVMALDDGDAPTMGWVAYASAPEAFAWLHTAPRTAAGEPALWLHVDASATLPWIPPQDWLEGFRALTLRVHVEDGWLIARGDLEHAPRQSGRVRE